MAALPFEPVAIDLRDGKTRSLKFTSRAIIAMEKQNGLRSLGEMFNLLATETVIVSFLWAGLQWEDKNLTIEGAADLLDVCLTNGGSFEDVMTPIYEALTRANRVARYGGNGGPPEIAGATTEAAPAK